jgi:hypothetical protein
MEMTFVKQALPVDERATIQSRETVGAREQHGSIHPSSDARAQAGCGIADAQQQQTRG